MMVVRDFVLFFLLQCFVLIIIPKGLEASGGHFCYTDELCDPAHWEDACLTGKKQSPIAFNIEDAVKSKPGQSPLYFGINFRKNMGCSFLVINNGHSIQVQMTKDGTSKAGFNHEDMHLQYKFSQLHFHWGLVNGNGSEHILNGKSFPLEVHMVHHKKIYPTLTDAVKSNDPTALSVIGIFFKIGAHNKALDPILAVVKSKALDDSSNFYEVHKCLNLGDFLPKKLSFFRYQGSLTTPPCKEVVLWTFLDTPLEISEDQINIFHEVRASSEHNHPFYNFRPFQPINGRIIEYFEA